VTSGDALPSKIPLKHSFATGQTDAKMAFVKRSADIPTALSSFSRKNCGGQHLYDCVRLIVYLILKSYKAPMVKPVYHSSSYCANSKRLLENIREHFDVNTIYRRVSTQRGNHRGSPKSHAVGRRSYTRTDVGDQLFCSLLDAPSHFSR
jgi:hypothetical protein